MRRRFANRYRSRYFQEHEGDSFEIYRRVADDDATLDMLELRPQRCAGFVDRCA